MTGKLPLRVKLSYGAGDIYGGGATTLISMYYLYFLTDVMGLSPAIAGTAFLVSKIWDAVSDPFMGIITDNTRTKLGRRRPYFLAGIVLIFVSFVLMWTPVDIQGEDARFVFILASYLFFSTVFTMVWVPYNALAPDLTSDYDQRTRLATFRMIFSNVAGILAGTMGKDFFVDTLHPTDPARGFFIMALCFGAFFALPYIATFLFCREDPEAMNLPKREIGSLKTFFTRYFREPMQVKPFRNVVAMYLFGFLAQDAVMALAVYFLLYRLGIPSMMTLLVPIFLFMLIFIPVSDFLAGRIGKRSTYLVSAVLWILGFAMVPLLGAETPVLLVYVFAALFGAGAGGIQNMVFAMFADIPDVDELFSGTRREGLFSGIFALLRKTGGALVMFFVGNGIQWAGYRPPVDGVQQAQTPVFQAALLGMFIGIPVVFILAASAACRIYPVTRERHASLKELLEKRHAGDLTEEDRRTERELKAAFGGES